MNGDLSILAVLLKAGVLLIVANEIRGLILAAPVLYGIAAAGGTYAAIWVGMCSLAGIGLSVAVPALAAKRLLRMRARLV
jgi:hypothetical protein